MAGTHAEVAKLIVTASGGPFRGFSREQLTDVTPAQAAKHPTWNMGSVITTNSATLVNKGLEVIEAHLLFDIPLDRIEVTVHPQSVIHSLVEYVDGSTMAQCSPPDMHLPIALGLDWPSRIPGATTAIDWSQSHTWTFEPLDEAVFPAVRLARQVGVAGSTFPAVYNAANEVAVEAFNTGRIAFLDIVETIERVVEAHSAPASLDLDGLLAADEWARSTAESFLSVT
jgi:1-deoxy-D-xylulose-5-phosphate reductoisomerase